VTIKPLLAMLLVSVSTVAEGQTWRSVDITRQLRDTSEHHVRVKYTAGRFSLRSTSEPVLFNMNLRYDEERSEPIHHYEAEARSATLGLDRRSVRWARNVDDDGLGEMRLDLSDAVPLDLDLELHATRARIDVGGLALNSLRLETAAADGVLDFSSPNRAQLRRLSLKLGAAGFLVRNLGNANVSRIRVEGGVGSVDLDFGQSLKDDVSIDASVALGHLALRLPEDVGVRVEVQKVLASFDHSGLHKRGDAYYSENWDSAKVRVRVRAETVFGSIEIDRRRSR
jgi:hypothetical protein